MIKPKMEEAYHLTFRQKCQLWVISFQSQDPVTIMSTRYHLVSLVDTLEQFPEPASSMMARLRVRRQRQTKLKHSAWVNNSRLDLTDYSQTLIWLLEAEQVPKNWQTQL